MKGPSSRRALAGSTTAAALAVAVALVGAVPAQAAAYTQASPATGLPAVSGVAVGPDGTAYLLHDDVPAVTTVPAGGATPFTTTLTGVTDPQGIAVGDGKLWIADTGDHQVVSVALPSSSAGSVTPVPVAGKALAAPSTAGVAAPPVEGTATDSPLNAPEGVAYERTTKTLYIADTGNNKVERVPTTGTDAGKLFFVAGDGSRAAERPGAALSSPLDTPVDVAVTTSGRVLVATAGGSAGSPGGVLAVEGGALSRVSAGASRAVAVAADGTVLTSAGTDVTAVPGGSLGATGTTAVVGLAVGGDGVVWAADRAGAASRAVTLTPPATAPAAPRITSTPPARVVKDATFGLQFTATGSPAPTWRVLPGASASITGLAFTSDSSGLLTGKPTASGDVSFTVRASSGTQYVDQVVSLKVGSLPGALTAKPEAVAGRGSATVTWKPLTTTGTPADGEAVTGYVVTPVAGTTAGTPVTAAAGASSVTVTGLSAGTAYSFTVAPTNTYGRAAASPASAEVTPFGGAVQPPAGLTRFEGGGRVQTAVQVSRRVFPAAGSVPAVVVAASTSYADSLAGARLASAVGGPLLLVDPQALNPEVGTEIARVLAAPATSTSTGTGTGTKTGGATSTPAPSGAAATTAPTPVGTIYLLGGTGAVSSTVETALKAVRTTYTVKRLNGANRYETAVKIAAQVSADSPVPGAPIYVASGANYPDGLAVAALAARTGGVVVLTDGATMPASTLAYLQTYDPNSERLVAVGGPAAKATSGHGEERAIAGADRYQTAQLVAARFTAAPGSSRVATVGLATGQNWPDALAGAAAMGSLGGPLLLTPPAALSPRVGQAVTSLSTAGRPTSAVVFGGSAVVSDAAASSFAALLAG